MAFNRDRNSRDRGLPAGRQGFRQVGRPRFGGRGDRGPVEMHKAICDNCRRECEVPFRPTQGKPIFCRNCFEDKQSLRSGDLKQSLRSQGDLKKNAGPGNIQPSQNNGQQFNEQLEALNSKLDKILKLLSPTLPVEKPTKVATKETETVPAAEE